MQTCHSCTHQNKDTAKFCADCGQRLTSRDLVETDSILQNRYRVMNLLGSGGFGAVYLAQDLRLGNLVAVKENFESSLDAQEQFYREAQILANLKHAHLPAVTDYFIEAPSKQYLVMEFIEGQDVEKIVERKVSLSESQALRWFDQVCEAVDYLHRQTPPIIHRDIKPSNIRINPDNKAILVDFGIAKQQLPGKPTMGGARAVTPGFSPLEQYGNGSTDARSDVYGLGATLYAMLTGQAPLDAMSRIGTGVPLIPPRQLNPAISPATEKMILRSLQIKAVHRLQSVQELREARPKPEVDPVLAGFGQRFAASLVDGMLLSVVYVMSILCAAGIGMTQDEVRVLTNLFIVLASFLYYTYFHARSGQTPGKKILRIKLVSTDGSQISTGQAIGRWVGYGISGVILYIGYLWVFVDKKKQAWHDKIAGTYVINVE